MHFNQLKTLGIPETIYPLIKLNFPQFYLSPYLTAHLLTVTRLPLKNSTTTHKPICTSHLPPESSSFFRLYLKQG